MSETSKPPEEEDLQAGIPVVIVPQTGVLYPRELNPGSKRLLTDEDVNTLVGTSFYVAAMGTGSRMAAAMDQFASSARAELDKRVEAKVPHDDAEDAEDEDGLKAWQKAMNERLDELGDLPAGI